MNLFYLFICDAVGVRCHDGWWLLNQTESENLLTFAFTENNIEMFWALWGRKRMQFNKKNTNVAVRSDLDRFSV